MDNSSTTRSIWLNAERYLKYFGWFVIGSIAAGLIIGHVPVILGHHWSTCRAGGSNVACLVIVHIWGVPIIGFSAFYAWYYFKKYSRKQAHQLNLLLTMTNAVNIVYLAFQTGMVLDSIRREAASWETIIMTGIAIALVLGVALGIVANQKLTRAIYQS